MEIVSFSIFDVFSFFGLFLLIDRLIFYGSFYFLALFFDVFYPFFSILFLDGSCRMWHQSGDLFFCKKPEKVEKSRKNDVFWGPKKRVKVGPFCTTPIFGQKSCFLAS